MPTLSEIERLPNQTLAIIIDETRYEITLKKTVEVMVCDIYRNDVLIVQGMRCLPSTPLLPYLYQEAGFGNFYFTTQNDDFPDYPQFGITQYLWHFNNEELVALRG